MFGIGLSEFFIIAFVIILFIKPADIPKVFRTLGRIAGKAKAAYNEVVEIKDQIIKEINDSADFEETQAKTADNNSVPEQPVAGTLPGSGSAADKKEASPPDTSHPV